MLKILRKHRTLPKSRQLLAIISSKSVFYLTCCLHIYVSVWFGNTTLVPEQNLHTTFTTFNVKILRIPTFEESCEAKPRAFVVC